MNTVDEVELDALLCDTIYDIILVVVAGLVVAWIVFDFDNAIVLDTASQLALDGSGVAGLAKLVHSSFATRITHGFQLLRSMSRAHPAVLDSVVAVRIPHGWVGQGRVQTIQVPPQSTVVAGNDLATSKRRLAALETQDKLSFAVSELQVILVSVVVIAKRPLP